MKRIYKFISFIFIFSLYFFNNSAFAVNDSKLVPYVYEDTKRLVTLVEDAASLIEQKGDAAFQDFAVKNSKWFDDKYYLFVYDLTGKCVFHPIQPGLIGKDLSSFRDVEDRPVIELITDVGKKPGANANGWVFYLWEMPNHYSPYWKSSYIRKVIAPNGNIYVVGSGLYNMKIEKAFIQERVNMAADLILSEGKDAAFNEIRKSSAVYHILGSYIFVVDESGNVVVDPSFPSNFQRNVSNFHDVTGRMVLEKIRQDLQYKDRVWDAFLWPQYESDVPSRMLLYVRKVKIGDEVFFVYGNFFPIKPVWMKT